MAAQIFVGKLKLVGGHFAQASCESVRASFEGRDATVDKKLLPKGAMHMDDIAFTVLADRFGVPQAKHVSLLQGEFVGVLKFVGNHMAKIECKETMQKFERDVTLDKASVPEAAIHGDEVAFKVMTDRFGLPQALQPRKVSPQPTATPKGKVSPQPTATPKKPDVKLQTLAPKRPWRSTGRFPELLAALAALVAFATGRSRAQRSLSGLALAVVAVRMLSRRSGVLADGKPHVA
jgi:hypothetical protein